MNGVARNRFSRMAGAAMAGLLVLGLSACDNGFNSKVTRFATQLPAPQGQSFAIVADDPSLAGGIEFGQYAGLVAQKLNKLGYAQAQSPEAASLIVHFGYGVDKGRQIVSSTGFADPYFGPWRGYRGFGYGGWGPYGGGWGGWGGRAWGYGWYDPWMNDIDVSTVYTSDITLKIDDKATSRRLFEGKAQAASASDHLSYLVPNLIDAMFTGFPGNSGETLKITIAPEKTTVKKVDVKGP
ncbi:MAG: DUF4136 domain-containing protein [Sphingomonadales bacterium]|nr:DUF4136 domain-containing protein [Sphingomonadales bacterium]MDE2168680.1 DUF4136 domain-containing protein [Sphingomonadales bacterium]